MPYTFITGGASSGKSSFALNLFKGRKCVTFIATARVTDPEMAERIKLHRRQRPASWNTIEEPVDLIGVVTSKGSGIGGLIIDCLTFWVSNLIFEGQLDRPSILDLAEKTAQALKNHEFDALVVSNEIGMGIVPADSESRSYRRIAGEVNQIFTAHCKEAFFVLSGIPVRLK
jgi:adenosylcobinamide kinase/adenosylcobinamide-phosphate guanylyltransferase